jgi:hypothetical protein
MKTLEQVYEIVETLNEEAHQDAWDSWMSADEAEQNDSDLAEELREEASQEQATYFREGFYHLDDSDRDAVIHWLKHDDDFAEQFRDWFGHEEYDDEFDSLE